MRLLAVCALLLFKVSFGDACASNKFTESGQCCSLCPAGFGVEAQCEKEDTKCAPCPPGTFSSSEGLGPCLPCIKCPYRAPMISSCSADQDTQCECGNGLFFMRDHGLCAPCSKCTRGEGAVRQCGLQGDTVCQMCGPGTFSEERISTKSCQACTQCSDSEVEIRPCMPNSDTLCMDKKLHILSRPTVTDGTREAPGDEVIEGEETSPAPGTPKFTPQDEAGSNNILAYVSVLAAVVLGLLIYVAYKCWRSCKQKKALSKARAAELGSSPEGEKLQSDSGVFLDSHSLQDNQLSKGTKTDSKQDARLYINLPPHRQEEVERLLQEGGGRGWRQLGAALGYEPEQLDLFGRGEAPAHTLLSNWAQKEGSTLGLLCSALARIERPDVVTGLTCPTQGVSVV
ncbi:tumor necrosis factor receptor superfamily member 16 isoform X2 [Paralichthys olivaceus]|uniref:tumor necrosis factor receptor superfamily member 16 isoform X2 n=1 Tax=Paralichthys olivaceus TaxID=8255 RepID=UPI00097D761A|nr:PREDICTED: tumor necrosis factor receptor superfamily member 16-like isoform X2 [Paralichthys olivaceus]